MAWLKTPIYFSACSPDDLAAAGSTTLSGTVAARKLGPGLPPTMGWQRTCTMATEVAGASSPASKTTFVLRVLAATISGFTSPSVGPLSMSNWDAGRTSTPGGRPFNRNETLPEKPSSYEVVRV